MPVFVKFKWRILMVLALPCMVYATVVWPDFKVADIQAKLSKKTLQIKGAIDFGLTDKAEEALSKGIALNVVIDIYLNKERSILWDQQVAAWALKRDIRYHALSGQYLVTTQLPGEQTAQIENFSSLQEALDFMGGLDLEDLTLGPENMQGDNNYKIEMRAYLDIAMLPAPLRPVAYTSPSWHLNSGWTTWKVLR